MTILLVGIGHVFDLRSHLRATAEGFAPSVVALEIDPLRFQALRDPEMRGRPPLTYRLLAHIQRKIAAAYHTTPGREMLDAYDAARGVGADVAMIDMDVRLLVARLQRAMPLRRRVKLLLAAVLGAMGIGRRRSVEREIDAFDRDPDRFFSALDREYPELKRILVDERNEFMAARIRALDERYPRVMVVVGDAHVPGISRLLSDLDVGVIRLRDLRRGRHLPGPYDGDGVGGADLPGTADRSRAGTHARHRGPFPSPVHEVSVRVDVGDAAWGDVGGDGDGGDGEHHGD